MRRWSLRLGIGVLFCVLGVFSVSAETARDIMQKVIDRNDGTTEVSRQKLATCRYIVRNKKIACAERPRVKVFEGVRKDFGPNEKDTRSVTIVREPQGERGIGFLQYDYEEQGKDSDQWMYLSALGKIKRIVSGNEDEPKTGSFFGSELSYEDLEARHIDDYNYKILKTATYAKRPTWIIESIPTPERARKSNYSKSIQWVDKERYLILKSLLYDRQGRKVKQVSVGKIENIDGIWMARRMNVSNLQTKRRTTLNLEAIVYNVSVEDNFLTQRTLTDAAFREQYLSRVIKELQ